MDVEQFEFTSKKSLYSARLQVRRTKTELGWLSQVEGVATVAILKKWTYAIWSESSHAGLVSQAEGTDRKNISWQWQKQTQGFEVRNRSSAQIREPKLNPVGVSDVLFLFNQLLREEATELREVAVVFPVGSKFYAAALRIAPNREEHAGIFCPAPDGSREIDWQQGTSFTVKWNANQSAITSIQTRHRVLGDLRLDLQV